MRGIVTCRHLVAATLTTLVVASTVVTLPAAPLTVRDLDGHVWTPLQPPKGEVDLLFFVTVDCPISNRYAPEIGRIATEYAAKGVKTLLVYADPSLDAAKVRAHEQAYDARSPLPAVIDTGFRLTAAVDATVTPTAAIFTSAGRAYRGRIDNLYENLGQARQAATRRDLRLSLDAVLAGKPVPQADVRAVGCYIERAGK
jgi:hypothetical protein